MSSSLNNTGSPSVLYSYLKFVEQKEPLRIAQDIEDMRPEMKSLKYYVYHSQISQSEFNCFENQLLPLWRKLKKQAPENKTPSLQNLQKIIANLGQKQELVSRNKAALLSTGLQRFNSHHCQLQLTTHHLNDQQKAGFVLRDKPTPRTPTHFQDQLPQIQTNSQLQGVHPEYYDYQQHATPDYEEFWTDFANCHLGGGTFTKGFVQEEIMVTEMPDFAEHVASNQPSPNSKCSIITRKGHPQHPYWVKQGSPTPYILERLHRVQAIDSKKCYGRQINNIPTQTLLNSTRELPDPQTVNVLAIAAPNLKDNQLWRQTTKDTVQDLYNTIVAGMTLAKQTAQKNGKKACLHSGQFGCGAFHNNPAVIYCLQKLAAEHVGVDLHLWGYSQDETAQAENLWNAFSQQISGPQNTSITVEQGLDVLRDIARKIF